MESIGIQVQFAKTDPEGRYVRGWASVVSVDGQAVDDLQDDRIAIEELTSAAHEFMLDAREAWAMHVGSKVGDVVESVIVDDAFASAMGMTEKRRGWWIGMQIHDEAIRKRVRAGELRAFSIGGEAVRTPVKD